MKDDLARKRTFLLCGHAQSGKTSLAEAIAYKSGAVSRLGKVDDATAISDYEEDEKERKSSINLSMLACDYKGVSLQFIDAPGYLDFIGETIAAARAVDFAVLVVDASGGVQVGTEKAWEILRKENLPCMFYVSKLDKEDTDFTKTYQDIRDSLSKNAVPFVSVSGAKISNILNDKANPAYAQIVEKVAESDDALLGKYLETGQIAEKEFDPALKKAVLAGALCPVVAGTSLDAAVEVFLDILVEAMPSVADMPARRAKDKSGKDIEITPAVNAPFSAQVFKTVIDPYVGQMNIFRVFSGKLPSNSEVFNATQSGKEKFGQIYFLLGRQQVNTDGVCAGDLAAVAKLRSTHSSDTLCDPSRIVELPALEFPAPAYSASVKPKTRQDEEKISAALHRLMSEDPTCRSSRDQQTKELLLSGMGELHVHVIIERLKRKYQADVEVGTPKVPYLETITRAVKASYKHKKQSGGHGQYGDVSIEVSPLERGKDFEFADNIVGGAIPRNFIPSVEKGVRKSMEQGILAGFPVKDVKVSLFDGSYHDVDSSDIAFQIAASMAFKEAIEKAAAVLLEPIMNVEITVPENFMGQVTGDINSKRGRVLGMEVKGKNGTVRASIPLAEMFKYASDLRSVTGGRGSYSMQFSHYDIVPGRLAQAVIAESKRAEEVKV